MRKRVFAFLLALCFLGLSIAINIADYQNHWSEASDQKVEQILNKSREIEASLSYTVWDSGRNKMQQELLDSYQQYISLRPYDANQWLKILGIVVELDRPQNQQLWVLEKSINLNKWNAAQHPVLAYHCIQLEKSLVGSLLKKCQLVFSYLARKKSIKELANYFNVKEETLSKRFFTLAGVRSNKGY